MASTLSLKFEENNRNGWVPYNPYGINPLVKNEDYFVGKYDLLYYSEMKDEDEKIIRSKLVVEHNGIITLYNNIKTDISEAEYIYHGTCIMTESVIYIFLKNDFSQERATLYLINSVGDSNRFIGLFTALSSNQIPVCIKIVCFKEELFEKGIDKDLLKDILTSSNVVWKNNMLTIEERQKHLFFSDDIKK